MLISDEMLMAYADGELDPAGMAEVERALAEDESLAERLAIFANTRRVVKDAFATAPMAVPDDLVARIRARAAAQPPAPAKAEVVDLASRRKSAPIWSTAVAASIALAVGIAGGWFVGIGSETGDGLQLTALANDGIVEALSSVPSGERVELADDNQFAAIATFQTEDGVLCREFEYSPATGQTYVAVACDAEGAWSLRFAVAGAANDDRYAPASSLDTLDAYLTATGAGQPLTAEDEAAVLAALR